ncbi:hypothetical protein GCM10022380_52440 [Amycolatopsis tucumanensis]|uniref:Uncharacterized protein n=1 Tax=Amycolatopsis tucumanensis TaxID=401106 RepID=A0ABP7IUK6_9PSEU
MGVLAGRALHGPLLEHEEKRSSLAETPTQMHVHPKYHRLDQAGRLLGAT